MEGGCSVAAQPRTALSAAQQLGGCSAKNGLFPLQLWCFPPPLFSRLCTGAMLGRGSERQCEEPQAGQAAAPHLKHHSASETPCPCKGAWDSGAGEMEKGLLACAGERTDKGNLCLSWAALASSSKEDTPSLLPTTFSCLVLWSLHRLRGRQMGNGSPAALPVSTCISPVTPSRMLPLWQTWQAGCAWGLSSCASVPHSCLANFSAPVAHAFPKGKGRGRAGRLHKSFPKLKAGSWAALAPQKKGPGGSSQPAWVDSTGCYPMDFRAGGLEVALTQSTCCQGTGAVGQDLGGCRGTRPPSPVTLRTASGIDPQGA